MKEIKLSQTGKKKGQYVALVDDEDFEYLNQWRWHVLQDRNTFYAIHGNKIWMHRLLLNTQHGMFVDHIDHNGLNNQKSNLRICTRSQNQMNRCKFIGKSKYKGVYVQTIKGKKKISKYIVSKICINNKRVSLGSFKTEKEAAIAYDIKAKEAFGEFANLNFK